MEARLEREIRRLPQVLACAITPTDIVVLVHPSADPAAVEREIMRILGGVGTEMRLKVLGEAQPEQRGRRRLLASPVLVAGLFGLGATVTLSVVLPGSPSKPPSALAPAIELGPDRGPEAASPVEEVPPSVVSTAPSASTLGFSIRVLVPVEAPELAAPLPEFAAPQVVPVDVPPGVPPPAPASEPAPEVTAPVLQVPAPPGASEPPALDRQETASEEDGRHHHRHGVVHRHPPVPGPHPHGEVHRHPPVPAGTTQDGTTQGGNEALPIASQSATVAPAQGAEEHGGDVPGAPPFGPPEGEPQGKGHGAPPGEPPGHSVGAGGHGGHGAGL